jgi:hypothetical protein
MSSNIHLTPADLAQEFGIPRSEVISFCMESGVPIHQGRIDKELFRLNWDQRTPHNYEGPGLYEHYKGGIYVVVGTIRLEYNESTLVGYMTTDPEHRVDHFYKGFLLTGRPLNPDDGPDCWNSLVEVNGKRVPRFKRIDREAHGSGAGVNL